MGAVPKLKLILESLAQAATAEPAKHGTWDIGLQGAVAGSGIKGSACVIHSHVLSQRPVLKCLLPKPKYLMTGYLDP